METNDIKCPYCGNIEMIEGVQDSRAMVGIPKKGIFDYANNYQPLYHLICKGCGAVVKSYVKNLEKLN